MAFTPNNSFLLTTDGRVFSWGDLNNCLGRDHSSRAQSHVPIATGFKKQVDKVDFIDIGEIIFSESHNVVIVQIATGKNHVIALDTKG